MGYKDKMNKTTCENCSHKQIWENETEPKCAYYHDTLCKICYNYCKGKHYININDGLSIYAFQSWIQRLTRKEKQLPITITINNQKTIPIKIIKHITKEEENWNIICKEK